MAENYKELYHWAKHMLDKYQDEIVPGLREQLAKRVEVVRCRECKHWRKGDFQVGDSLGRMEWGGGCPIVRFCRTESNFCDCGERRDDGDNE